MRRTWTFTFDQQGDFAAMNAAERFLADAGFSVGRMQRGAPRGILLGDYDIQKWRNLRSADVAALHGRLIGDRRGPVTVTFYSEAPEQVHGALYEANDRLVATAIAGRAALLRDEGTGR